MKLLAEAEMTHVGWPFYSYVHTDSKVLMVGTGRGGEWGWGGKASREELLTSTSEHLWFQWRGQKIVLDVVSVDC